MKLHFINRTFVLGVLLGPIFWVLIYGILVQLYKRLVIFLGWFKGLPIVQWPAMYLIVFGSSLITRQYCEVMRYEDRLWYSPLVTKFNLKENGKNAAKK